MFLSSCIKKSSQVLGCPEWPCVPLSLGNSSSDLFLVTLFEAQSDPANNSSQSEIIMNNKSKKTRNALCVQAAKRCRGDDNRSCHLHKPWAARELS